MVELNNKTRPGKKKKSLKKFDSANAFRSGIFPIKAREEKIIENINP